ncbi:hypothetical protein J056_003783 [Wallemia ichthyophaga EXF-994]|uniref:Uncharacterized protein n=1 Tax=Wallemia ichthyophaga (strain EXF-994 / CBS 113033) TaxID=1299270 RepID=R9AIR9_WALI9|nr:uncharacterized protein J056_003783 [Wallemia ichthyophaga EXF-994]EOR02107.1 hypothetical protein J056_003783 [Wallemia ichthyophaga EXF-994]
MTTAQIVLPNFYKFVLCTEAGLITNTERLLAPSSFGSYLSFEILNTKDGKFKMRTREVDGGAFVGYSDSERMYLHKKHAQADEFEIHLNTIDSTFHLLSSTNGRVKCTGNAVYPSLTPPLKI